MTDTSIWVAFLSHSFLKEVDGKMALVSTQTVDGREFADPADAWEAAERLLSKHENHRIENVQIGIRPADYKQPEPNISRRKN